jgi:hypothetical protein
LTKQKEFLSTKNFIKRSTQFIKSKIGRNCCICESGNISISKTDSS